MRMASFVCSDRNGGLAVSGFVPIRVALIYWSTPLISDCSVKVELCFMRDGARTNAPELVPSLFS